MSVLGFLEKIAPTAASLLAGPFAGLAVELLGPALGIEDATVDKVKEVLTGGQLNGEQIAAIKQAEIALKIRLKELDIDLEKISASDRDSARQREASVGDKTTRNLAYLIVGSFVGMVAALLVGWGTADSALAGTLIGYLSAKAEQVASYYFGSSSGSSAKNDLLATLSKK